MGLNILKWCDLQGFKIASNNASIYKKPSKCL